MANLKTIQFLRNATIYGSLNFAKTALESQAQNMLDGSPLIARYLADGEERSILGIVHVSGSTTGLTIFNNSKEIENVLEGLDYTGITTSDAAVVTNVTEANGMISATSENVGNLKLTKYSKGSDSGNVAATDSINEAVAKLENQIDAEEAARIAKFQASSAASVANENRVVTDVTQSDGKITATAANITGIKLDGYAEGSDADIAATDTLGQALGKLQAQINAMDLTVVSGDGEVIVSVSEDDGKVAATKSAIKDVKLTGYVKNTSATGDIAATDDIEDALSKLENKAAAITIANDDGSINVTTGTNGTNINVNIKNGEKVIKLDDEGGGIYTNLNLVEITGSTLPAEVKVRYELRDSDNTKIGESIDIPKDSHIVSINYITSGEHAQNLEYVYIDVSGETKTTYVDMSALVLEAEFASGVTVDAGDHIVHGVVDSASEKDGQATPEAFLTVGADGFKISGIKNEITRQINLLDAVVTGGTTAGTATSDHVQVIVGEADGKLSGVTVTETNIANADDLAGLSGKTFTVATSSNASITTAVTAAADGTKSVDLITDASKIQMSGFTADASGFTAITQATSVKDAVKTIETEMIANEQTVSTSLNDLNTRLNTLSGKTFTEIGSSNDSISATTTAATDGTVAIDLVTDTSKIKLSGFTEVPASTDTIPSNGDTINTALAKIYATAKHHHLSSGNKGITVTNDNNGTTATLTLDTVSAKSTWNGDAIKNDSGSNALTITDNGLFLSRDWDCGTF